MPDRMLPKEIEKTLDKLGKDGDKVRGTIERDFADYVKQRQRDRRAIPTVLLLAAARPVIGAAARRTAEYLDGTAIRPACDPDGRDLEPGRQQGRGTPGGGGCPRRGGARIGRTCRERGEGSGRPDSRRGQGTGGPGSR